MAKKPTVFESLTDEQVLNEFVKRFDCDGAVLIYLDSNREYGFGKWQNKTGKKWVDYLFKNAQENRGLPKSEQTEERKETISTIS